jgi:hypothetical protein
MSCCFLSDSQAETFRNAPVEEYNGSRQASYRKQPIESIVLGELFKRFPQYISIPSCRKILIKRKGVPEHTIAFMNSNSSWQLEMSLVTKMVKKLIQMETYLDLGV